nr:calmodulin-binding protein 60 B-like [Tanacetum cinerariifolium]
GLHSLRTAPIEWLNLSCRLRELFVLEERASLVTPFSHGLGTSNFPFPTEPFDKILHCRLLRYPIEAQTFPEPILYLAGLSCSWDEASNKPAIFVDGNEMSFKNFLQVLGNRIVSFSARLVNTPVVVGSPSVHAAEPKGNDDQDVGFVDPNDQNVVELNDDDDEETSFQGTNPGVARSSKSEAKKRKQEAPNRGGFRGSVLPLAASGSVPKGIGKHARALVRQLGFEDSLDSDPYIPSVQEAHFAHNDMSRLHYNMLTHEGRFLSEVSKLRNKVVTLKSKHVEYKHDISKLEDSLQNNQDTDSSMLVKDLKADGVRMSGVLDLLRDVARSSEDSRKAFEAEALKLRPLAEEIQPLRRDVSVNKLVIGLVLMVLKRPVREGAEDGYEVLNHKAKQRNFARNVINGISCQELASTLEPLIRGWL